MRIYTFEQLPAELEPALGAGGVNAEPLPLLSPSPLDPSRLVATLRRYCLFKVDVRNRIFCLVDVTNNKSLTLEQKDWLEQVVASEWSNQRRVLKQKHKRQEEKPPRPKKSRPAPLPDLRRYEGYSAYTAKVKMYKELQEHGKITTEQFYARKAKANEDCRKTQLGDAP